MSWVVAERGGWGPERPPAAVEPLFESSFIGGFECSYHRLESGVRLDLQASTRHVELADRDYSRLRSVGIRGARDGVSWIHAARRAGAFDFTSARPLVRAADRHAVRVAWDLMHFGWPDEVDVFQPSFPGRFAVYARAFARWLASETDQEHLFVPVNEMSFLAWAGGDVRVMNPFEAARGVELKAQLVRATIEAIEAIRDVLPRARFLQPEPVIHLVANPAHPKTHRRVESDNLLQYQAWDMLCGRVWPSLGGSDRYLDVVGVNFYPDNQFTAEGETIHRGDRRYKAFARMLLEVGRRYGRPMIVSETGSEGDDRSPWLRYVGRQCAAALRLGCDLHAVTLYPIVNHPGWGDDRHCRNGLWDYADEDGERPADPDLMAEVLRQGSRLAAARAKYLRRRAPSQPSAPGN
jgi:hypothetical protein